MSTLVKLMKHILDTGAEFFNHYKIAREGGQNPLQSLKIALFLAATFYYFGGIE